MVCTHVIIFGLPLRRTHVYIIYTRACAMVATRRVITHRAARNCVIYVVHGNITVNPLVITFFPSSIFSGLPARHSRIFISASLTYARRPYARDLGRLVAPRKHVIPPTLASAFGPEKSTKQKQSVPPETIVSGSTERRQTHFFSTLVSHQRFLVFCTQFALVVLLETVWWCTMIA